MARHLLFIAGSDIDQFYEAESFLGEGDVCNIKPLGTKIGGCVLNAAAVSSMLGSDVKVIDYLKSDDEGSSLLLKGMSSHRIDTSHIRFGEDVINGSCLIMKVKDEKCIYVIEPRRPFFEEDAEMKKLLNDASYIYSLMHTVKISFKGLEALKEARRQGAKIVFDGASQYKEEYEREMLLEMADALFMNKTAYMRLKEVCGFEVIEHLLDKGSEFICITDGARGATCYSKEGTYTLPAYKVDVVDSTGAGDSFAGCFLHFRNKGIDLKTCLEYASANGALACTREGGMAGAVSEEELMSFIKTL